MTTHAFSVFSTDSEGWDRSVDENNFYFSEKVFWFEKKISKKWEISKKNLGKIKNFGFLRIIFFEKLFWKIPTQFFAQDDSTSIAVLPSTLGGLKVHCRNFVGHFFDKNHQIFGFSRSRVPWCSAMFHRVPRHDLVFLAISRTLSFQNIQKHHSTEI